MIGFPAGIALAAAKDAAAGTRAYQRTVYARLKADGRCSQCRTPVEGRVRCRACQQACGEYGARLRGERVAQGLCGYCGKQPPEPGRKRCGSCREQVMRYHARVASRRPAKAAAAAKPVKRMEAKAPQPRKAAKPREGKSLAQPMAVDARAILANPYVQSLLRGVEMSERLRGRPLAVHE